MTKGDPSIPDSRLEQQRATAGHSMPQTNRLDISTYYDRFMYDAVIDEYYGHSDFHNFGLWRPETNSASDACRALVRELVEMSPPHPSRVLEVGCGKGAGTRELRAHWPQAEITAIDISETQIETCRQNCPDASFLLMDACKMTFDESSFDVLISIEAAFHFPSRRVFLENARRVLRPGGRLVLQDVLYLKEDEQRRPLPTSGESVLDPAALLPSENYLSGPEEYETLLHDTGFEQCRIVDATVEGPRRFYRHFLTHLANRQAWDGADPEHIRRLRIGARLFARQLNYCLLVSADTPR